MLYHRRRAPARPRRRTKHVAVPGVCHVFELGLGALDHGAQRHAVGLGARTAGPRPLRIRGPRPSSLHARQKKVVFHFFSFLFLANQHDKDRAPRPPPLVLGVLCRRQGFVRGCLRTRRAPRPRSARTSRSPSSWARRPARWACACDRRKRTKEQGTESSAAATETVLLRAITAHGAVTCPRGACTLPPQTPCTASPSRL